MKIRAHLITGFLGAGKTTTVLHLLRELHSRGERAAVLVNDFGALGIDGTLLKQGPALAIKEIPEGCICCTLAPRLHEALMELATTVKPPHVFIEPTGLAKPSELRRLLEAPPLSEYYTVAPVLALVDPATFLKLHGKAPPFYVGQLTEADVLVANKLDRFPAGDLPRFRELLTQLNPRAKRIETTQGQVPIEVLEGAAQPAPSAPGHDHAHSQSTAFLRDASVRFDAGRVRDVFAGLERGTYGPRPWRAKGFFRCEKGWLFFGLSDSGVDELVDPPHPGESRCDILGAELPPEMARKIEAALQACVLPAKGGAA